MAFISVGKQDNSLCPAPNRARCNPSVYNQSHLKFIVVPEHHHKAPCKEIDAKQLHNSFCINNRVPCGALRTNTAAFMDYSPDTQSVILSWQLYIYPLYRGDGAKRPCKARVIACNVLMQSSNVHKISAMTICKGSKWEYCSLC